MSGRQRIRVDGASTQARAVGARLRELRIDAEFSQRDIAARMGSHRPIVGRIERGVHALGMRTVARYAEALELDVETVLVCLDPAWRAAGEEARSELLSGRAA